MPDHPLPAHVLGDRPGPASGRRQRRPWAGFLAAAGAGLLGGVTGALVVLALTGDDTPGDTPGDRGPARVEQFELTSRVAEVAVATRPGVVRIESTQTTARGGVRSDIGSGVIIDRDGHVVTNAHVVLGTETLSVVLPGGERRSAALLGHDFPFTDVAVLLIGPVTQDPIPFGDSDAVRAGDTVIAVGNPLGEFDGSITVGVVSGTDRARTFDGVLQPDLIQTDAAVNHGNSGGALVNLAGELVGLPTVVIRESGGRAVEGIALALPSNRVREIALGIIAASANYPRPSLGVEAVDLSPEVAGRFSGLHVSEGALVTSVVAGGPADAAGIRPGDVLVRIGDRPVDASHLYLTALAELDPGATVEVVFNRAGRIIETDVPLSSRD